ncbi:WD40 repeat domain-containing protein [Nocardia australiensis]|uniref:WD40 repeat domain-containing protein n=1 Tax=Nocardia australiensis TaxID=2887191 RepID=UPI001D15DC06|nr:WD40 repeat domain-containing protein [Nocardia australiensis]
MVDPFSIIVAAVSAGAAAGPDPASADLRAAYSLLRRRITRDGTDAEAIAALDGIEATDGTDRAAVESVVRHAGFSDDQEAAALAHRLLEQVPDDVLHATGRTDDNNRATGVPESADTTVDRSDTDPDRELHPTSNHAGRRGIVGRRPIIATLIALVTVAALGVVVIHENRESEEAQRRIEVADDLIDRSRITKYTDPYTSRLAALAAWRLHESSQAHQAMLDAVRNPLVAVLGDTMKLGVGQIAFSPDGRLLAAAAGSDDYPYHTVRLWDPVTHRPVGAPLTGHTDTLTSVAFSPDGSLLASGSLDATVRLWDPVTHRPVGEPIIVGNDELENVKRIAFSPDGRRLATISTVRGFQLWDLATRRPIGEPIDWIANGSIHSVAFSPDGRLLAIGNTASTVVLWDPGTLQPVGEPLTLVGATRLSSAFVGPMAFSPDGRLLATTDDIGNVVVLWDLATRRRIVGEPTLFSGGYLPSAVVFSPDGHLLATDSNQGVVRLWDPATGQQIGEPLADQYLGATTVAFSPDGHLLATNSDEGGVRLWDPTARPPVDNVEEALCNQENGFAAPRWPPDIPDDMRPQLCQ